MPPFTRTLRLPSAVVLAAVLLVPGCDDPAELVKEVNDARAGCTEEQLRASSEECVQMFDRYAEMATEAMHTYIGGIKAMNEALARRPPAQFDTTGLGHALTPPPGVWSGAADPMGSTDGPSAPSLGYAPLRSGRAGVLPEQGYWGEAARGGWVDPRLDPRRRVPDARGWDPRRSPQGRDVYGQGYPYGRNQQRYPYGYGDPRPPYGAEGGRGWYGDPGDPRWNGGPQHGRYGPGAYGAEPRDPRWRQGWEEEPDYQEEWEEEPRHGPAPTAPGVLLPPEQRLDRPWLRSNAARRQRDPRYRDAPPARYLPDDPYMDNPERYPPRYPRW